MKRILQLLIINLFILFFTGCGAPGKAVEVIIDGDGQFPKNLAGLWRSENNVWDIYFEPDGKVSWAVISLGEVKIEAGKNRTVPMRHGGKGIFEPGQWSVIYLQRQRELSVEIAIDYFRTELGDDVIHGKTRDIFTGSVSPDGTLWQTDRFSYPEYIVDTETYKSYKLPVDPNENPKETLLFRKISD
ncbi:MAG: hypothetical protein JXA96_08200 [Sedimentisphaerales bacterium]|nr:hypothetical protein [Sedimentisphaerales bacterium]